MKLCRYLMAGLPILLFALIAACSSLPANGKSAALGYRPDWWLYQSPSEDYIYSYGQGQHTSVEKSLNAARNNAQDEASQYVEGQLREIMGNFTREAGIVDPKALNLTDKLIHAISEARYSSSYEGKIETRDIGEMGKTRYKTWVQIVIPKAEINANLINNLSNEEYLSSLFQNSPSFLQMERMINKR